VGAHQKEAPVGVLGQRGPGLLAVDQVVFLAVIAGDAFGPRLQRREVGAGARLGVALAPPHLAGEDAGQEARALRLGPERVEHWPKNVEPERRPAQPVGAGLPLEPDVLLPRRPTRTAILHRPARRAPALGGQDLLPAEDVFLAERLAPLAL